MSEALFIVGAAALFFLSWLVWMPIWKKMAKAEFDALNMNLNRHKGEDGAK